PRQLLFDNTFHLGTGISFPEFMLYNLETDADERRIDIKNVSAPYNSIGALEVSWKPLGGVDESAWANEIADVEDPAQLVGRPWTYRVSIVGATGLPFMVDHAFVQYQFDGQVYTTETIEQATHNPEFNYACIHHVEHVTEAFVASLKRPLQFNVWVSPYVVHTGEPVSTSNPRVL
ncbi:unnamed protein product, partial [Phaeothamnion confervicola]